MAADNDTPQAAAMRSSFALSVSSKRTGNDVFLMFS